jgi:DNA polymerase III epsilon subunit-like protein
MMASAYYAKKIPQYIEDIRNGKRIMASTYEIRQQMLEDMALYDVKVAVAHNARFDYNALNITQRYTTKSAFRYWFPYGTEIWDTMKMARDVIHNMPTYRKFCEENDLLTKNGRLSATAENLYRFITHNPDFEESHTGLEDVQIEREILWYCMRQHKAMRKKLWENDNEIPEPTDLQKQIMRAVRGY